MVQSFQTMSFDRLFLPVSNKMQGFKALLDPCFLAKGVILDAEKKLRISDMPLWYSHYHVYQRSYPQWILSVHSFH